MTLVALMVVTAVLTVVQVMQVGARIEELTYSYLPAYGDLARANIRSLEQALSIRRIIIDKLQSPEDSGQQTALRNRYVSLGGQVELEILAARALIQGLIAKGPAFGEVSSLSQFESRIDAITSSSTCRSAAPRCPPRRGRKPECRLPSRAASVASSDIYPMASRSSSSKRKTAGMSNG